MYTIEGTVQEKMWPLVAGFLWNKKKGEFSGEEKDWWKEAFFHMTKGGSGNPCFRVSQSPGAQL